jgi:D-amino-acid oxidase
MLDAVAQRVLVVGAGVIGLCCAVRLAEAGHETHVLARDLPLETTSAVAGALWFPYRAEPVDRVTAWGRATLAELHRLNEEDEAAGVLLREGVVLSRDAPVKPPWADGMAARAPMRPVTDPAPGYPHGLWLRVPLVDMSRYLPRLVERLAAAGGTVTRMPLPALPQRGVVVNATGISARALAGDPEVYPVRGQVVVLENPGLTRWLVDEHEDAGHLTYVLPRTDTVIVGGTAEVGDWDLGPDPETSRRILERAVRLEPRLRGARLLAHRVGLRPARPSVRLDAERRGDGAVVHCYGHGGSGVTLSWGCADDVLRLVDELSRAPGPGAGPQGE